MTGGPVAAPVLQLRVPEDTLARIDEARGDDSRSAWLLRLIDRELSGQQPALAPAVVSSLAALPSGEPSHGTPCRGPGCFQRDTRTYGLASSRSAPPARPALQGQVYKRELPPGAERLIRRGAA